MEELTILDTIAWAQDPLHLCAQCPVIPASNFEELATDLLEYPEVTKTAEEMVEIFTDQSKRFAACGANHSDRLGVIRRNPETGWQYIVDLVTAQ